MDLVKKLLRNTSRAHPVAYKYSEVAGHKEELVKLINLGVLQQTTALTFPCNTCGSECEIKRLENGTRAILCSSCVNARLKALAESDAYEYTVSLERLLKNLLSELEFTPDEPMRMLGHDIWSLGTQEILGTMREVLYLRDSHDIETGALAILEQRKALHPIIFCGIAPDRPLNVNLAFIPLENILRRKGGGIFSRELFDRILGDSGETMSTEAISLGDSDLVLDTAAVLYGKNVSDNYKFEKLEPLERNLIENLYRHGMADKNRWHSRRDLASRLGVSPESLSNALTKIRKIEKKVGMAIIEQNRPNKGYRINPDLLPH